MFVKDDYSHTRGVGAVASMDAASPGRRLAAARAARRLARRDALMAASTLGRAATFQSPATGSFGSRTLEVDHFGRGSGGLKPPGGGGGGGGGRPPGLRPPGGMTSPFSPFNMVKSPGSVISTAPLPLPPPLPPAAPTKGTKGTSGTTKPSSKSGSGSSGGGGGGGFYGGGGRATGVNVGPLEPLPEEPTVPEEPPQPAPAPPKKTSSNLLLYAALGVGAWWLLKRK